MCFIIIVVVDDDDDDDGGGGGGGDDAAVNAVQLAAFITAVASTWLRAHEKPSEDKFLSLVAAIALNALIVRVSSANRRDGRQKNDVCV